MDPKTREGIPYPNRQMLLREQLVLDFAIKCAKPRRPRFAYFVSDAQSTAHTRIADVSARVCRCVALPFGTSIFKPEDLNTPEKRTKGVSGELHYMGCLAMRLARHIIRDSDVNKEHGLKYVDQLQGMMGYQMKVVAASALALSGGSPIRVMLSGGRRWPT